MTNEQINFAIARALGYTEVRPQSEFKGLAPYGVGSIPNHPEIGPVALSDYCTDLNAMAFAKAKLLPTPELKDAFGLAAYEFVGFLLQDGPPNRMRPDGVTLHDLTSLSAQQQAEALLKTLNLWTS